MRILTGLSSNTFPGMSATELAAATISGGGSVVDLRMGRHQRWEDRGACAAFTEFSSAGLKVAFVARGLNTLGGVCRCHGPCFAPIKVNTKYEAAPLDLLSSVREATAAGWKILFETHSHGPSVDVLLTYCEELSVRLVFDNRGFFQLGWTMQDLKALAPYVRFIQVKGFDRIDPRLQHRELRREDLAEVEELLTVGASLKALTVETNATVPFQDLDLVNQFARTCEAHTGVEVAW